MTKYCSAHAILHSTLRWPFDIETNVSKDFFKIIDNFPQNNILAPVIYRSKVKLSYRTMKNMNQIISSHYAKVQASLRKSHDGYHCAPMQLPDKQEKYGRVESVIYRAMITREDIGATKHYTNLNGGTFKTRWYGHCILTFFTTQTTYRSRLHYIAGSSC